ncbi:MAG: MoxR family ATPase [Bacteroidales bacterium]|nr:MoxR family ATPase [Bacteroidales bacterium]
MRINDKQVLLSEPYEPNENMSSTYVGRQEIMETINAAWLGGERTMPLSPILVGEPGVGKNRIVYELGKMRRQEVYIFQGHSDVSVEDLACMARMGEEHMIDYILSPVSTAMDRGGIIFIDEIAKIRPRALSILVSVLDERRYIDSTLLGERIKAHPDFRFIAATNKADLVGNTIPEFILSRIRPVIFVDYQKKTEIDEIIQNTFEQILDQNIEPLINQFWVEWNLNNGNKDVFPSPRDVIYLFNLSISISRLRKHKKVDKKDMKWAFQKLYNNQHEKA